MIFRCPHCGAKAAPSTPDCPTCSQRMVRRCAACAEEIAATATICKYCGDGERPERRREIEIIEKPAMRCAWEDLSKGVGRRWWGTWLQSNLCPREFFRNLPVSTGHKWPLGFAYGFVAQVIVAVALVAMGAGGLRAMRGEQVSFGEGLGGAGILLAAIPATFLAVAAGLYAATLCWHLLLKVLGGRGAFQGTLRVVGYASGAEAWNLIPYVGPIVATIFRTLLHYHGFREVHGLSKFRAFGAAILPVLVAIGVGAAVVGIALSQPLR